MLKKTDREVLQNILVISSINVSQFLSQKLRNKFTKFLQCPHGEFQKCDTRIQCIIQQDETILTA